MGVPYTRTSYRIQANARKLRGFLIIAWERVREGERERERERAGRGSCLLVSVATFVSFFVFVFVFVVVVVDDFVAFLSATIFRVRDVSKFMPFKSAVGNTVTPNDVTLFKVSVTAGSPLLSL